MPVISLKGLPMFSKTANRFSTSVGLVFDSLVSDLDADSHQMYNRHELQTRLKF